MTEIVRMTWHPSDREIVVLRTPPDLAQAMGTFEPARYAEDMKAYLIHHDHVPALYRWARFQEVHVIDERKSKTGKGPSGPTHPPMECRRCTQPGSFTNPPRNCPSCGASWSPTPPPVRQTGSARTTECAECHHQQPGRFPFCSRCGARMAEPEPSKAVLRPQPRVHLDDPLPLNEVMGATRVPLQAQTHGGRRIEDVNLPEPDLVNRQHLVNTATAAIRHEYPVPSREVAEQQVAERG